MPTPEMNVQLAHVISDISGVSGQAIIGAILQGERDPYGLAGLVNYRIKASPEEVARSLEGNGRPDVLFELQQAVDSYHFEHRQMQECDDKLTLCRASLPGRTREIPALSKAGPETAVQKNRIAVVLRTAATTLLESDTHLGARYRHLRRQLPPFKAAVKAMARYLAVLIHRLLTHGQAWIDQGAAQFERKPTGTGESALKGQGKRIRLGSDRRKSAELTSAERRLRKMPAY